MSSVIPICIPCSAFWGYKGRKSVLCSLNWHWRWKHDIPSLKRVALFQHKHNLFLHMNNQNKAQSLHSESPAVLKPSLLPAHWWLWTLECPWAPVSSLLNNNYITGLSWGMNEGKRKKPSPWWAIFFFSPLCISFSSLFCKPDMIWFDFIPFYHAGLLAVSQKAQGLEGNIIPGKLQS